MTETTGRGTHPFAPYARRLQDLRTAAGHPSFATIAREIGALRRSRGVPAGEARVSRVTVYDCFRQDRKRVDTDLVLEIVTVLTGDPSATAEWAAGLQEFQRRNEAAALVRVTTSLPAPMDVFVGRETELSALARNRVTWVSGMPGTGKSQLAFAAARRLIDAGTVAGVLFADLRGFSPEGPPADPGAVVSAMLRLLGTQPHAVSESKRATTLANEVAARNMLLILDDAASVDQVNQVVPDLTTVRALITSRFAPEVADPALTHLRLSPFTRCESVAVLSAVAGSRATAEPDLMDTLLETTGDLPLAVHLTASRVAARPNWTMAEHAQFATARHEDLRLHDALHATFDLTYSSLPEPAQQLLRLIAVHPEALLDEVSIAALAGNEIEDVPTAVADLVRANLLTQPRPGNFQIHELPRIHAADLSTEVDPPSWRQAGNDRFLRDLVHRAWSAQQVLKEAVGEVPYAPRSRPGSQPRTTVLTKEEAWAFFDAAADLLLSLAMKCSTGQSHDGAVLYAASEAMMAYLHQKGRYGDAQIIHQEALQHATTLGDELGRARALTHWGSTLVQIGRNEQARKILQAALEATEAHPVERLMVHNSLGVVYASTGADTQAEESYRRALALAQELGDLRRSGFAWSNLAYLSLRNGDTDASRAALERAIEFATRTEDAASLARDHINLASLLVDSGDLDGAYAAALTGHEKSRQIGMAAGEVVAAVNIAAVLVRRDRFDEALEWVKPALAAATELGMVQHQVTLHGTLSVCLRHLNDAAGAAAAALDAVVGSIDVGDPDLAGESVAHLAECVEALPDVTDHPRWGEVHDLVAGMDTAAARSVESALFARTPDPSS